MATLREVKFVSETATQLVSLFFLRILMSFAHLAEFLIPQNCQLIHYTGGDSTCGGLVKESNVLLHETAKACCASQYNWIDVELCSARSTKTSLEKYWADKSDSKCRKDSEAPTTDLSVQIYDTAEECCTSGIFWLSKDACLAASDIVFDSGTEAAGSNKFYVDWIKGQCVKDCVGPAPCGGLAQLWDPLYDSDITCCARIPHVPDEECVFS